MLGSFAGSTKYIIEVLLVEKHTPRRNAVPLSRQSSANIFVALKASSILAPDATTAQTIAPADEPAKGVVS